MIRSFTITNNLGENLFLDIRRPEDSGFLVSSVTGLGPIKASVGQTEFGMYDGSILSSSRLSSRNIVMNLIFFDQNKEKLDIEKIRHKCYLYFPVKREITLIVTNDTGDYRIKGVVESNEIPIFTQNEGAQISIICPDPYFERADEAVLQYISRVVPNFSFPVSFEAEMANIPEEEEQPGMRYIVDENGNYYYEYVGPYSVTSKAYNFQVFNTNNKFFTQDLTVNEIPYNEEANSAGGKTVKIGGGNGQ